MADHVFIGEHKSSVAAKIILILPLVILAIVLGYASNEFELTEFVPDAGSRSISILGTLFVIALFVERAQQVYISAWRGLKRRILESKIRHFELAYTQEVNEDKKEELKANLAKALSEQTQYRYDTQKMALIGGMALGILISFAGPRILSEIIVVHGDMTALQSTIFNAVDILITGGLIGGGSEGIHKLVVLITDFMDKTRERVNNSTNETDSTISGKSQ